MKNTALISSASTIADDESMTRLSGAAVFDWEVYYGALIRDIPLLSEFEERELTRIVANHPNTPEAKAALDRLTESNLRLVVFFARKAKGKGVDLNDLVQEGTLGLIKAIKSFNPELGFRLATYAGQWIRQAMQRLIANQGKSLRAPVHVQDKLRQIRVVTAALEQSLMRCPTDEEVAQAVSKRYGTMTLEELDDVMVHSPSLVSLDQEIDDEHTECLSDFVADDGESPSDVLHHEELHRALEVYLDHLPLRSRVVIERVYGWNGEESQSLTDIAKDLNLSRERVRQLHNEALVILRDSAANDHLTDYLFH